MFTCAAGVYPAGAAPMTDKQIRDEIRTRIFDDQSKSVRIKIGQQSSPGAQEAVVAEGGQKQKNTPENSGDADAVDKAVAEAAADVAEETEMMKEVKKGIFEEYELGGLGFKPAIGAVFMGGDAAIDTAVRDSAGVLRVTRESDVRLAPMFVAHYLFGELPFGRKEVSTDGGMVDVTTKGKVENAIKERTQVTVLNGLLKDAGKPTMPAYSNKVINDFAWGPTVGLELKDDGIRSMGLGVTFAARKFDIQKDGTPKPRAAAFNITAMAIIEQSVKGLADGFTEGMAIAEGEVIRYQDRSEKGLALIFSAGF